MPAASVAVLPIRGLSQIDVARTFNIAIQGTGTTAATRNTIQGKIDDVLYRPYPWYWPSGQSTYQQYFINDALILPADAGRSWYGNGKFAAGGVGGGDVLGSSICGLGLTIFDGVTNKLAVTGSSPTATVTVTGKATNTWDVGGSIEITAGTNFTPGWYGIKSVVAGASGTGTWTLDRTCNVGAATAGVGTYFAEVIRDLGGRRAFRDLGFNSHILVGDSYQASNLYHVVSGGLGAGEHKFDNCSFAFSKCGILCGPHLGLFDDGVHTTSWDGISGDHGDHLTTRDCLFNNCDNAIVVRNIQSLDHHHENVVAVGLKGFAYRFDSGGYLVANNTYMSGQTADVPQGLLRIGAGVDLYNDGCYLIRGFRYDGGGTNTRNPQLVVTDWSTINARAKVVIDGGLLAKANTNDSYPLVDVQSRISLTLRDIQGDQVAGGIWASSVRLGAGGGGSKPMPTNVENCWLDVTTNPQEIIDETHSVAGCKVNFRGCCKPDGTALADATYTTVGP